MQEALGGKDAAKSFIEATVEELMLEREERSAQGIVGMDNNDAVESADVKAIDPEELSEADTSKAMCDGDVSVTDDARQDGSTGGSWAVHCNPTVQARSEVCRTDVEDPSENNGVEHGMEAICVRETQGGPRPDAKVGQLVSDAAYQWERPSELMEPVWKSFRMRKRIPRGWSWAQRLSVQE